MGRRGRATVAGVAVVVAAVATVLASSALAAMAKSGPGDWPGLQGGALHGGAAPVGAPAPAFRVAWHADPMGGQSSPVAVEGSMAVAEGPSSVNAFDPATGSPIWAAPRAAGPVVAPAIAATGTVATVVIAQGKGSGGSLAGLDATSGRVRWTTALSGEVRGAPVVQGSTAYVGTQGGDVFAVDASTGTVVWKARAPGVVDTSPAVAGGRVLVIAFDSGLRRERLLALDATSGAPRWSYDVTALTGNVSSVTVAGGTAVAGFGDGTVRAFSIATGHLMWSRGVRYDFSPNSSPAVSGGEVYALDRDGGLYAFGLGDGARGFDYQFDVTTAAGAPLVVGTHVDVGLGDGSVAVIDVGTADLVDRVDVGGGSVGPLTPAGGLLLAPSASRGIAALANDPGGSLTRIPSPTKLFLGAALGWYAAAAVTMFVIISLLFRFVARVPPDTAVMSVPGPPARRDTDEDGGTRGEA